MEEEYYIGSPGPHEVMEDMVVTSFNGVQLEQPVEVKAGDKIEITLVKHVIPTTLPLVFTEECWWSFRITNKPQTRWQRIKSVVARVFRRGP